MMQMMRRAMVFALCAVLSLGLAGCDNYPRDPHQTLNRVHETGTVRIGVVHNPPWTDIDDENNPRGSEVRLLAEFSRMLQAEPVWRAVSMDEGFRALDSGEIDILIGGLPASTPYKKAGLTRPYTKTGKHGHIMAVRRGENAFLVELEKFLRHIPEPQKRASQ